jgi:hypothetical protein
MAGDRRLRRAAALFFLVALSIGIGSASAQPQQSDDLDTLNQQIVRLYQAGKYAEATDIAKRALALAERRLGQLNSQKSSTSLRLSYGAMSPLYPARRPNTEYASDSPHPASSKLRKTWTSALLNLGIWWDFWVSNGIGCFRLRSALIIRAVHAKARALSEVTIRRARVSSVPQPTGALAGMVERAKSNWSRYEREMPLLIMERTNTGAWLGKAKQRDMDVDVVYSEQLGVEVFRRGGG